LNQVHKYLLENKKRLAGKHVYGITIINHMIKTHVEDRNPTFRDAEKERDAVNAGFSFMSTIDLVRLFLLLKEQKISFDEFRAKLKIFGLITI
jgi:hypothetical protein